MAADIAADTELKAVKDCQSQAVEIEFLGTKHPQGITFVMKSGANWYKTEKGQNFNFPTSEEGRELIMNEWAKKGGKKERGGGIVRTQVCRVWEDEWDTMRLNATPQVWHFLTP